MDIKRYNLKGRIGFYIFMVFLWIAGCINGTGCQSIRAYSENTGYTGYLECTESRLKSRAYCRAIEY